jgi:hypothetical protein
VAKHSLFAQAIYFLGTLNHADASKKIGRASLIRDMVMPVMGKQSVLTTYGMVCGKGAITLITHFFIDMVEEGLRSAIDGTIASMIFLLIWGIVQKSTQLTE